MLDTSHKQGSLKDPSGASSESGGLSGQDKHPCSNANQEKAARDRQAEHGANPADGAGHQSHVVEDIEHAESFSLVPDLRDFQQLSGLHLDGVEKEGWPEYDEPSNVLRVYLKNPERQGDGSLIDGYTTYEVEFETVLGHFGHANNKLQRRYRDFVWLYSSLGREYEGCILPPLPDRHVLEYWDRFSPDFIHRRQLGLDRFLQRISQHPVLCRSESLRLFLENKNALHSGNSTPTDTDMSEPASHDGASSSKLLSSVSEALSQLLSRVQITYPLVAKGDKRKGGFGVVYEQVKARHGALKGVCLAEEKLLNNDIERAALIKGKLSSSVFRLLENTRDGESTKEDLEHYLDAVKDGAGLLDAKIKSDQAEYVMVLKEMADYTQNAKAVLKFRAKKETEYLHLLSVLGSLSAEREKLCHAENQPFTLTDYVGKKIERLRGVDPVQARQERLLKVEETLLQVKEQAQDSERLLVGVNARVAKELKYYQKELNSELAAVLVKRAKADLDFGQKVSGALGRTASRHLGLLC